MLCLFSKGVGIGDSNEAEALAILEALRIFSRSFYGSLILENDSSNAMSWVSQDTCKPWKLHFYFNEIKYQVARFHVIFHQLRSANGFLDTSAKQGVDRVVPWEVLMQTFVFRLRIYISDTLLFVVVVLF